MFSIMKIAADSVCRKSLFLLMLWHYISVSDSFAHFGPKCVSFHVLLLLSQIVLELLKREA